MPFPRTDLSRRLCDGYAKRGVAVQDCDADLDLDDLSAEVPRHEALADQFHTMHLGSDTAAAVISAPSSPDGTAKVARCVDRLVAGYGTGAYWFPGVGVFACAVDQKGQRAGSTVIGQAGIAASLN